MIATTKTQVIYEGDGKTKVFPITFPFHDALDVRLLIYEVKTGREREIVSGFVVDKVDKTVIYPGYVKGEEPPEKNQEGVLQSGYHLIIYRYTPRVQLVDLGEKYPLPILEKMSDKLTLIVQEIEDGLERSFKFGRGEGHNGKEWLRKFLEKARDFDFLDKKIQDLRNMFNELRAGIEKLKSGGGKSIRVVRVKAGLRVKKGQVLGYGGDLKGNETGDYVLADNRLYYTFKNVALALEDSHNGYVEALFHGEVPVTVFANDKYFSSLDDGSSVFLGEDGNIELFYGFSPRVKEGGFLLYLGTTVDKVFSFNPSKIGFRIFDTKWLRDSNEYPNGTFFI